jgi:ferredoxin
MIESETHRQNLINIAEKIESKYKRNPIDGKGNPTETYLEYLSLMYDSEISEMVQHLEVFPTTTTLNKFSEILNLDKKVLQEKLNNLAKKGFISKVGSSYALPTALLVYDMPFILEINYKGKDGKIFAELSRRFYDDGYYKRWQTTDEGIPRTRILTVSEEIEPGQKVVPLEEVYEIIKKHNTYSVIPCPCRSRTEIEGIRECKDKYPIHNCILFGIMAQGLLQTGDPSIRQISEEEVIKLTKEAAEIGLVHLTQNNTKALILCACCECCCGMLKGLTKFDNPRAVAKANYIPKIDDENCIACGTCIDRCKFNAITVDEIAEITEKRCIGCGLCAVACPNDAIKMIRIERETIPEKV